MFILQICDLKFTSHPLDHLSSFRTYVSSLHFWTRKIHCSWKYFSCHDGDNFLLCWWAILVKISPPDELVSTIPLLPSFDLFPLLPSFIFFPRLPSINFFPLLPSFNFFPLLPSFDLFPLCTFQMPLRWEMIGKWETKSTCPSLSRSTSSSYSFVFCVCQSFWFQTDPFCQNFQVEAKKYFGLDKGVSKLQLYKKQK